MGICMLKIRWSWNRLIFNMGIPVLVRWHFYIEMAPGLILSTLKHYNMDLLCIFFVICLNSQVLGDKGGLTSLGPDGTKPLPEPKLTNHQLGLVAFTWVQFHRKWSRYLALMWIWKITNLELQPHLPGATELIPMWHHSNETLAHRFPLRFHRSLFQRVQLTIFQHWLKWWLGVGQATSHYLSQWWLVYWHIYESLGLSELMD